MKRLATFLMLMFFASIMTGPSMFMLSIEKGKVYTEKFSLNHIIKTAYSSQTKNSPDRPPTIESCRIFCHRHIQLTRCTIPEKRTVPANADIYAGIDFLPTYAAFFNSLATSLSRKQLDSSGRLKLPLPPLLQSSVLLI
jgi:hypothetical protein